MFPLGDFLCFKKHNYIEKIREALQHTVCLNMGNFDEIAVKPPLIGDFFLTLKFTNRRGSKYVIW